MGLRRRRRRSIVGVSSTRDGRRTAEEGLVNDEAGEKGSAGASYVQDTSDQGLLAVVQADAGGGLDVGVFDVEIGRHVASGSGERGTDLIEGRWMNGLGTCGNAVETRGKSGRVAH